MRTAQADPGRLALAQDGQTLTYAQLEALMNRVAAALGRDGVAPRTAIQEYEVAGRKAFVPVIAFNALYEWSGGKEQSSAAYLVGRGTKSDKLGPLRLGIGPQEFRRLDARPLPTGPRRARGP